MKTIPMHPSWIDYKDVVSLFLFWRVRSNISEVERILADYVGKRYCILSSSGRSLIFLTLKAMAFEKHSKVAMPAYTCVVVPNAVVNAGLKPSFVDVELSSYNVSYSNLKKIITKDTKAIILTHLYGIPHDVDKIVDLAKTDNIFLIEDFALAFGSLYKGIMCGKFGDVSITSFNTAKNIISFGGGALFTDNESIYLEVKRLQEALIQRLRFSFRVMKFIRILLNDIIYQPIIYGNITKRISENFDVVRRIGNPIEPEKVEDAIIQNLCVFQIRLLKSQLNKIGTFRKKKDRIYKLYHEGFQAIPNITLPFSNNEIKPMYSHYPVLINNKNTKSRDAVLKELHSKGIWAGKVFDYVCAYLGPYNAFSYGEYDNSGYIAKNVINLPFHPYLSDKQVYYIIEKVGDALRN